MRHYLTPEYAAFLHVVGPLCGCLIILIIIGCFLLNRDTLARLQREYDAHIREGYCCDCDSGEDCPIEMELRARIKAYE